MDKKKNRECSAMDYNIYEMGLDDAIFFFPSSRRRRVDKCVYLPST